MERRSILLLCAVIAFTGVSCKPAMSKTFFKVHDILNLLPKNKIQEIEMRHLKNDEGFRAAIYYLQSKEWRDLVDGVVKKPEYVKFVEMVEKYSIDLPQAITCIRDHIHALKVTEKPTAKPDLEDFINEVQSVLPISEIVQALSTNLAETGNLRAEIGSKENQKIANEVHNLPEMVKMREILKEMKFDVEPYIALVYTFLGWIH